MDQGVLQELKEKPFFLIISAPPNSGKTYMIEWILLNIANSFKYGCVFCPEHSNSQYSNILPSKYIHNTNVDQMIKNLITLQNNTEKKYRAFLILDDCLGQSNLFSSNIFQQLITTYRHLNISIFLAVQYIKSTNKSPLIQTCASHVIIFKPINTLQYKNLFEYFGSNKYKNLHSFQTSVIKKLKKKYSFLIYIIQDNKFIYNDPLSEIYNFYINY